MLEFDKLIDNAVTSFFTSILNALLEFFNGTFTDISHGAIEVLNMPFVINGLKYAQTLAFAILVAKVINEVIQTYILYQNGDPDADPNGVLVRTAQAIAVIASMQFIITEVFKFGTKIATDISNVSSGALGIGDTATIMAFVLSPAGNAIIVFIFLIAFIMLLIVAIQAAIRGAELALMAIVGPVLALNLTSNNRSIWSTYFKQLIIISVTQAVQIFMLQGAFTILARPASTIKEAGILALFGWLWVAVKTPKFLQQFAHSTGFAGSVGGGVKRTGSMYFMRKMMAK